MPIQHYRSDKYHVSTSIGYLVRRASALMTGQLEPVLSQKGLNFTQWLVLMQLREGSVVNARAICSTLRHDSGALTRLIDQLEERGLVERQRSLEDRRSIALRLTQLGGQVIESLIPALVDKLNGALRDFSSTEAAELTRLLIKLVTSLTG